jgi:hypothetical protein
MKTNQSKTSIGYTTLLYGLGLLLFLEWLYPLARLMNEDRMELFVAFTFSVF